MRSRHEADPSNFLVATAGAFEAPASLVGKRKKLPVGLQIGCNPLIFGGML